MGAASAREFAKNGDLVILVARSADALNAVAQDIGGGAVAVPCDAADPAQVAAMAKQVVSERGVPDVIIHCAGAGEWKTVQDTTPEEAVTMMQAPYFAAFNVTHAFLPKMLERGTGVIIHVNSPACIAAWPSSVGYAAARAALKGFHEALSQDLAGTGLRSCHVIFGHIATNYFDNNPGVADKFPALDKTIPTLSPQFCALKLMRLARHPRHSSIYPFMLRLNLMMAILLPRFARWLLRF